MAVDLLRTRFILRRHRRAGTCEGCVLKAERYHRNLEDRTASNIVYTVWDC